MNYEEVKGMCLVDKLVTLINLEQILFHNIYEGYEKYNTNKIELNFRNKVSDRPFTMRVFCPPELLAEFEDEVERKCNERI